MTYQEQRIVDAILRELQRQHDVNPVNGPAIWHVQGEVFFGIDGHVHLDELVRVVVKAVEDATPRVGPGVDIIAKAIKDETDNFNDPVCYYVQGEALDRWRQENPDNYDFPEFDELESYRIIARSVAAVLEASETETLK